jgi:glutathione synthase/RimK-type ligase-like ATP-grasp enzyme
MRVLLLGNSQSYLAKRLEQESAGHNHSFKSLSLNQVILDYQRSGIGIYDRTGADLTDFDVYFFYAIGRQVSLVAELAKHLKQLGKVVVEDILSQGALPNDKISFMEHSVLSTVPYRFFFHLSRDQEKSFQYPLIAKTANGSLGQSVAKINNHRELGDYIQKHGRSLIIQSYLPIKSDYRVIVVGNQALGAMERVVKPNDFLSTRAGGARKSVNLAPEVLAQCVQAVQAKGLALAGVDLVKHYDHYHCFEINSSPQIRIFEKITGLNVAGEIFNYLTSKR